MVEIALMSGVDWCHCRRRKIIGGGGGGFYSAFPVPIDFQTDFSRFSCDFFELFGYLRSYEHNKGFGIVNFMFKEGLIMIWTLTHRFQYRFGTTGRFQGSRIDLNVQRGHLYILRVFGVPLEH